MGRDLLLIQKAKLDLSYPQIADRMSCDVSQQQVGKWFSKDCGVPIDKIPDLLKSLELKVVPSSAVVLDEESYRGLCMALEKLGRLSRKLYDEHGIGMGDLE